MLAACGVAGLSCRVRQVDRLSIAPIAQPPAISDPHHDRNFVGSRRIGNCHSDRIEMRERPGIVLMPERHIENRARSGHFDIRSNDRFPAADAARIGLRSIG